MNKTRPQTPFTNKAWQYTMKEKIIKFVKNAWTEVKRRVKNVKEELKDVGKAVKKVANQIDDVGDALVGEKRKGRKRK